MLKFLEKHKVFLVFLPLIIYWIALFVGTSIPVQAIPSIFEFGDKLEHMSAYAGLSILLNLTIAFQNKFGNIKTKHNLYTFLAAASYGIIDELHQIFIPGRSCELLDFVADLIGISLGLIILNLIMKIENYRLQKIQPRMDI
ncbi:MAG TPA: VanZ family protein [Ignavibacteriaceae bacterium]|nr:VanZ family protein [Ignavibacteriaceae bacterium]